MKNLKLFFGALAIMAMTFVACEPNKGPEVRPEDPNDSTTVEELEIPMVDVPEAGKTTVVLYVPEDTPEGCYAVGTVNAWAEKDPALKFAPVEGADSKRWVAYTFDYAPDMEMKVLAIPSDPEVALGWSYQWGKNMDPENDLTEDNVVIVQGDGEFVLENSGQPKLRTLTDGGVVYIHVKAWATTPVIEAKVAETAAIKHPWNGGDWTYQEMTKVAEGKFEYIARYGNTGVNIATDVNGSGENWYPEADLIFEGEVAQGDSVKFTFVSEKGTVGKVTVSLIEKGTPVEVNKEGEATFTLTANNLPEGFEVGIVGKFKDAEWNIAAPVVMTKEGDVYTAKAVVAEACEYKYFVRKAGAEWSWDFGEDGGNRKMPLDLKAVDTVDTWKLPTE